MKFSFYLNVQKNEQGRTIDGYQPGHKLELAFHCEMNNFGNLSREECADKLSEHFDISRPHYYKGRSMSVGDVLLIDGVAFAYQPVGWKQIDTPPYVALDAQRQKLIDALEVLILTPHIYQYLVARDPKALEQAVKAVRENLPETTLNWFNSRLNRVSRDRTPPRPTPRDRAILSALNGMLVEFAPHASETAEKSGEASLHSAVRAARAASRKLRAEIDAANTEERAAEDDAAFRLRKGLPFTVGRNDGRGEVTRHATLAEAEGRIVEIAKIDPEGVARGDYYVDGPDELVQQRGKKAN
jgi:hypothetical protein